MQALLVDDHTLFREGMKALLRLLRPDTEVLQAGSVREAIDILSKCHGVDLVLLDLQLPGMRGLDALDAVRAFNDEIPIVVLSGNEDSGTVRAAIEHGAMGFIQKSVNPDEMLGAVETVLGGRVYLPEAALAEMYPLSPTRSQGQKLTELGITGRRAEVLRHLAHGKSTKAIARELNISDTTVKSHIQAVYEVLNVHSRTQAVFELASKGWSLTDVSS